jgi:putative SOS response-associated peptidase YedK
MCGRFASNLTWEQLHELYQIGAAERSPPPPDLRPLYNIAPTQTVPVVRLNRSARREIALLRWGLIPYWSRDAKIAVRTINARAETLATAPAFREAFRRRRCLVPASGFYEWKKVASGKQPYFIGMRDGSPLAFAGLWERWKQGETAVESFTIVTGEPSSLIAAIHDRMPAILQPDDYDAWLSAADPAILRPLLQPFPAQLLQAYPVSARVNSVKNDDAALIEPVPELSSDERKLL